MVLIPVEKIIPNVSLVRSCDHKQVFLTFSDKNFHSWLWCFWSIPIRCSKQPLIIVWMVKANRLAVRLYGVACTADVLMAMNECLAMRFEWSRRLKKCYMRTFKFSFHKGQNSFSWTPTGQNVKRLYRLSFLLEGKGHMLFFLVKLMTSFLSTAWQQPVLWQKNGAEA